MISIRKPAVSGVISIRMVPDGVTPAIRKPDRGRPQSIRALCRYPSRTVAPVSSVAL
jgi:hypothetical protein